MSKTGMKQLNFTADPALVTVMIESQAGTLTKAIMEGVMNSADAKATRIDITTEADQVVIEDNGVGFVSAEEIELNFGIMGRPHKMDEEGRATDARYAKFRIGRGQMFNFGVNDWYTNNFHIHVDFRKGKKDGNVGFSYKETDRKLHAGCKACIRLYSPCSMSDLRYMRRELRQALKYMDIPVYLDGVKISKPPQDEQWDVVNNVAYIKRVADESGVEIYNDGVYVETISHWLVGCSGVVVSKKSLVLNSARNQVLRSSPSWKSIDAALKGITVEKSKTEKIRSLADAHKACELFEDGEINKDEFAKIKCLPDVTGHYWSVSQILKQRIRLSARRRFTLDEHDNLRLAYAAAGSRAGDNAIQSGLALVLDERVLEWVDMGNFFPCAGVRVVSINEVVALQGDQQYEVVDVRTLKPQAELMLRAINGVQYYLSAWMRGFRQDTGLSDYRGDAPLPFNRTKHNQIRKIIAGRSAAAHAWTDGRTFVAFDVDWLSQRLQGRPQDFHDIAAVLIHEYTHDERTDMDHTHSPDFFADFHHSLMRHGGPLVRHLDFTWRRLLASTTRSKSRVKQLKDAATWRKAHLEKIDALGE